MIWLFVLASIDTQTQTPNASVDSSPARYAKIEHADLTLQPNGLTIEIALSAPYLPQGVALTNPYRLVFDFPGFTLPAGNRQMLINNGPIRRFRAALFQSAPPVSRIVIDLREPVNFDVKSVGNKVVIEVPFPNAGSVPVASKPAPVPVEKKVEKKKDQGTPGAMADTAPKTVTAAPNQVSSAGAYKLQDKAKDLKVEDLQSLEDKASAGDPEAETSLALALHSGTLLRRDDAEALRLLRKAADQGSMAAQESLGIFSAMGIGREQPSPAEALEWYKKAARQGSLDAATNIALMYDDGIGIPKDRSQAMIWFRRAAEGGDATAQYNLALIYGRGKEVPQDYKESLRWLTAAADQNVVPATLDLAAFYLHPPDGTPADVARAIHYYEKAADLGSVPAEVTLGNIFANGVQGKPDYEKAVTWYRKAADQGHPDAQFGLALRYALGQGVPLDLEEALPLFVAAANQGQAGAQFNLATMYEEGKGTPADQALALHYYQLSADRGMSQAQFRLGRLLAGKKESRADQVSAYKWLMLAGNSIKESSPILADLRKSMSQEEINEAERDVD
ncbi:MAG TPA: AMIN domain-containing protein, partial [Blastocatellia bacterium]